VADIGFVYFLTPFLMKQFTVNVLAKWQIVIPKELRDELWIQVSDSLTCFVRWSAVVLKKKIQALSYWPNGSDDKIPFWVGTDGRTLSLAIKEMKWITCLLGKAWFGKSVHALNLMVNMYTAGKSLIVFDPYGELLSEIKNYIGDDTETSFYHYIVGESPDWTSLKKKILKNKQQKVITIGTNYASLWLKKSVELSQPILLDAYKDLVDDNVAVLIDEFGAHFDEKLLWVIAQSQWYTCICDQWWESYSVDQVALLCKAINHIAIYQVWWLTAKYLVDILGVSHAVQSLRAIEKYHFYFYSFLGHKEAWKLLSWIYPIQ
jgi:AbrB family looped-hinge helix DNA binding protein